MASGPHRPARLRTNWAEKLISWAVCRQALADAARRGSGVTQRGGPIRVLGQSRGEREDRNLSAPITLLDIILIAVMLVSALLAMIRGFMREILSIAAWVIAALATLYAYSKLLPYAKGYF